MNWWKNFIKGWNGNKTVIGGALLALITYLKMQHPDWPIWQEDWFSIVEYVLAILTGGGLVHKGVKLLKNNGGNVK